MYGIVYITKLFILVITTRYQIVTVWHYFCKKIAVMIYIAVIVMLVIVINTISICKIAKKIIPPVVCETRRQIPFQGKIPEHVSTEPDAITAIPEKWGEVPMIFKERYY